jgi:hypothetical protein
MTPPLPQLDYLIIACHPNDAEIGCGGAILDQVGSFSGSASSIASGLPLC